LTGDWAVGSHPRTADGGVAGIVHNSGTHGRNRS
jgi:hypothetical protein